MHNSIYLTSNPGPVVEVNGQRYYLVGQVINHAPTPGVSVTGVFTACSGSSMSGSSLSSYSTGSSASAQSGGLYSSVYSSEVGCDCDTCPSPRITSITGGSGDPRCTQYTDLIGATLLSGLPCQWSTTGTNFEVDLYCLNGQWHMDMYLLANEVDCTETFQGVLPGFPSSPEGDYVLTPLSIGGCCSILSPITVRIACHGSAVSSAASTVDSTGSTLMARYRLCGSSNAGVDASTPAADGSAAASTYPASDISTSPASNTSAYPGSSTRQQTSSFGSQYIDGAYYSILWSDFPSQTPGNFCDPGDPFYYQGTDCALYIAATDEFRFNHPFLGYYWYVTADGLCYSDPDHSGSGIIDGYESRLDAVLSGPYSDSACTIPW